MNSETLLANLILIMLLHWVFDFIVQTHHQATNKSHSIKQLSLHILTYSSPFLMFGLPFLVVNSVLHWITDFFTSKISSSYFKAGDYRRGFMIVGFDQLMHFLALSLSFYFLGKPLIIL